MEASVAGGVTTGVDVGSHIDARPIGRFQWLVVALCFCVAMIDGFDTQAAAFVAPLLRDQMQVGPQGIGNLYSSGLFGLMIGALAFGAVADRVGRKPVIILACLAMGGFSLLAATARDFDMLLVYRFLTGLGLGAAMPNINALTAEYAPSSRRAVLMTVMFAGFPTGAILGGLISVELIEAFGWRSVFVFGGVVPILFVPVLFLFLPESIRYLAARGQHHARVGRLLRRLDPGLGDADKLPVAAPVAAAGPDRLVPVVDLFTEGRLPGTALIWLTYFGTLLMMYSLLGWLPTVMSEAGLGIAGGIYTAVAFNAGGVVGGLLAAYFLDRNSGYRILSAGYVLAALVGLMIGGLGGSLVIAITVIFLGGATLMGAAFAMNAVTAAFYPTSVRSTGLGWGLAIGRIGAIVGPLIIGAALAADWSVGRTFAAVASPSLVCAISIVLLGRLMSRRAPAS